MSDGFKEIGDFLGWLFGIGAVVVVVLIVFLIYFFS